MTAPLSHAGNWDDNDVPVLTDLAPEAALNASRSASANLSNESTSPLVMDELPLLELDIPLDFQLYSADDPARDVTPMPFDDLPLLGDEPQPLVGQFVSLVPSTPLPEAESEPPFEAHFEPVSPVTEAVPSSAVASIGGLGSIPVEALPHGVLGGGLAALDNTDMLASIEKRLAALRAATGIGPGGIELRPAEPEPAEPVVAELPEAEAYVPAESVDEEEVPSPQYEAVPFEDIAEPTEFVPVVDAEVAPVVVETSEEAFDVNVLPFEPVEPEPSAVVEPVVESNDVVDDWAAAPVEEQALPDFEPAAHVEPVVAPVQPAALPEVSSTETAGKSVAVVGESVLIESLYQMIMPRMKAELSLWLQDAIKMQNEQLLEGVMRQLKTDYDMMFGETLRESLRQAVADVSRISHKEQG